jgi:hypothetical protein
VQRRALDQGLVVLRVLAGVIDEGEPTGVAGAHGEADDELLDELRELGHVGLVAGIGVAEERDAAVGGHDEAEAEADDAQVRPLLLGVTALGDRGVLVARVDVGGEVGHVEHQARQVDGEDLDHAGHDAPLDLCQMLLADGVHGVPEPPVVESGGGQADEPVARRGLPPLGELALRARVDHPVRRGQRDVGPDRRRRVLAPRADHLVDDLGDSEALEHRPHRRQVAVGEVAGAVRLAGPCLGEPGGDLLGRAEVALGDDPGFAPDPGRFDEVVVGLPAMLLSDDRCHI